MNQPRIVNPKVATFLLGVSIFFTGASGLVGEYILSTLASYLLGNSIEQFSVTIALMLGMMGIGGWVQKYINDSFLLEKFILIETLLALSIGFAPLAIYAAFGFLETHFLLILYAFILTIGFLIGFEIPLIIRINEHYASALKSNLSTVISADYFGSLVGALVWVYWMLPNFTLAENGFILSSLNFVIAVITVVYLGLHSLLQKKKSIVFMILFSTIFLIYVALHANQWNIQLQQHLYNDKIVLLETTKYQQLVVTHSLKRDEYRFYINGNLQFSSLDEYRYHEQLLHPVVHMAKNRRDVLVLGGGDGMALRELAKYKEITSITLVDLDPALVKIASTSSVFTQLNNNAYSKANIYDMSSSDAVSSIGKQELKPLNYDKNSFLNLPKDSSVTLDVMNIDADRFLDEIVAKRFDIVVIDFPDPSSIDLNKLYTKEFYLKLKRLMREDAMFVVQSTSPFQSNTAFTCIGNTLEASGFETIKYHDNIPTFGEWGWHIGWKKGRYERDKLLQKVSLLENFKVQTRHLSPQFFIASTQFPKGKEVKNIGINTLMEPKLFMLYNKDAWYYE